MLEIRSRRHRGVRPCPLSGGRPVATRKILTWSRFHDHQRLAADRAPVWPHPADRAPSRGVHRQRARRQDGQARPRPRTDGARLLSSARTRRAARAGLARLRRGGPVLQPRGFVLLYAILRLQALLPLNPQGVGGLARSRLQHRDLASSPTPTGRPTAARRRCRYFTPDGRPDGAELRFGGDRHRRRRGRWRAASPATAAKRSAISGSISTRSTLYMLLPLSIVVAVALVALGVPQNSAGPRRCDDARRRQADHRAGPGRQPDRHQAARHQWRRLLQRQLRAPLRESQRAGPTSSRSGRSSSLALGLAVAFGRMIGREREGWALLGRHGGCSWSSAAAVAYWAEGRRHAARCTRSALAGRATWRARRCASASRDVVDLGGRSPPAPPTARSTPCTIPIMPLGGMVPLVHDPARRDRARRRRLGPLRHRGLSRSSPCSSPGLMVGRTPEYLGKKIEAREVKIAMLAVLITAGRRSSASRRSSAVLPAALAGLANSGPARLSRRSSMPSPRRPATTARPSPASTANTPWYNTTLGIAMLLGRFGHHRAGAGDRRIRWRPSRGSRLPPAPSRPHGLLFVGLLTGVILIMGGLQFFPALALGPIVEHFQMLAGHVAT